MSIPAFKNSEDWQQFCTVFEDALQVRMSILKRVRDVMYPGSEWNTLDGKTISVIDDITRSVIYDAEWEFKKQLPEYKTDDDELFIPRRSFKEDVTEALKEAMGTECPPCDPLACADHLTDE